MKLGVDPQKAINNWRADGYIEELEEKEERFKERIESVLEYMFDDPEDRAIMSVKKPPKGVMAKALEHGDAQWGEDWENNGYDGFDQWDLMSAAIYAVSPESLKKNEKPPKLHRRSSGEGSREKVALFPSSCS
ncbi:MAG: hypothetical protein O2923_13335 [Verrucomicrobia bacterium]|nr:hypothetical protein [Verrucomicrobiota bacterium]